MIDEEWIQHLDNLEPHLLTMSDSLPDFCCDARFRILFNIIIKDIPCIVTLDYQNLEWYSIYINIKPIESRHRIQNPKATYFLKLNELGILNEKFHPNVPEPRRDL